MFEKILIANRGEIARRVIRTAKRMGISTVAVYSDADQYAPHVIEATEAVRLGPAPSNQSYLLIDKLIEACRSTGAQAVHPGYGFVSENADFARALAQHDIAFIGPPVDAISAMGDKIESKRLAANAGVNTIPGIDGEIATPDAAVAAATEIGYPVMLKASAGGGGKGMRIAHNDEECRDGFVRAASEALASFGDDRMLIEKFITQPRHIEIQVLADSHGHCIHLGERECSIQRRHQKVIEEAPSPLLDEATRQAMGAQAITLAQAVGYSSAGTVEFVADAERNFYFLEMNTRLQVEHPVTEAITGIDLVEQMIRVAAGEHLAIQQADLPLPGAQTWAIEGRVYAENPARGFVPSTGRLHRYIEPTQTNELRVDAGVAEGSEISMFYDPMIAKVIGSGADRQSAIRQLLNGLDSYCIRGVSHNISFLQDVLRQPRFVQGEMTTAFIADEYGERFDGADASQPGTAAIRHQLIALSAIINCLQVQRERRIQTAAEPKTQRLSSAALPSGLQGEWIVCVDKEYHSVFIERVEQEWSATIADVTMTVTTDWLFSEPLVWCAIDHERVCIELTWKHPHYELRHKGVEISALVMKPRAAQLHRYMREPVAIDDTGFLLSPMPGLLVSVDVAPGDTVQMGDELAVVEAMKMENVLRAQRNGVVAKVCAAAGDSVAADQAIIEFE